MEAASSYRQVRITLTEVQQRQNPHLRTIGFRVMVKPINANWDMKQTVLTGEVRDQLPLATLDAVYESILEFLAQPPLPGVTR